MINQELLNFIQTEKDKGLNENAIKGLLLNSGWALEDINQAFPQNTTPPPPPQIKPSPQENVSANVQNTEITPMSTEARLLIIFITLAVVIIFALGVAYFGKKYIQSQKNQPSSGGRYSSPLASVL